MELRPLGPGDDELLRSLEEQEDVWEFVGTLPLADTRGDHWFAVVEGGTTLGLAGLVQSQALAGNDFELIVAMRSEAQRHGLAKEACRLALAWAFDAGQLERVIACIDDNNEAARAIATKVGMVELCPSPPHRTVFVTSREQRT